ncbi:MAG: MFS transporter [Gammaproteobacteria bacterium]|nr:MFS transporter [Gammaproteobacteria bacterium]
MNTLTAAKHTKLAWAVTLTAALFFFYEFIQLILPNAINVQLMQAFDLNAPELGWLASMYFCANAIFLFPAGNLLDRYSTKKLLLGAVALCTIGTFVFAIAPDYRIAAAGRFVVGIGAAFCFLSCIRVASRWFPPSRMALVTGVVVTMAMLGGFVAQSPLVLLTKWIGWRHAILWDAGLGIFIALAIIFIVQDRPPNSHEEAKADKAKLQNLGFLRCIKLVLLNPNNWLGGIYTSLLNLPVFLLGGLWGMRYLVQVHNLTEVQASYATSMLFVGVIFGSPMFGWFSDHIGRRCLPMILGAVASLIVMLILMYTPDLSLTSLIILFFLIGFVTSSQVLSYPAIAELNPISLTGTAVSIASVTIMCSGVIFQPLFGWMLELNWDHTMVSDVPVYSAHDFNTAMWIMPIAFVIGIAIAAKIRETYCQAQA